MVALSKTFTWPVCAQLPERLSSSNEYQNSQHGPVRQGKDPYRQRLEIQHAYKLLDSNSAENSNHLSCWVACLASVGEKSEQQGCVLEELILRRLFVGEPPPRPCPRQAACLRHPLWYKLSGDLGKDSLLLISWFSIPVLGAFDADAGVFGV